MITFQVKGHPTIKINRNFSLGNGLLNTVPKFFTRKIPYWLNESRKTGFEGTFSSILVVLLGRLFIKTIGFTGG